MLVFCEANPEASNDIWVLRLDGDRMPEPFVTTPFSECSPRLSPDGRWVAYASNESGRTEVYVQAFPGPGGKRLVSTQGGGSAVWSRTGRELFYTSGDRLMAVDITTEPMFAAGLPRLLFEGAFETVLGQPFDVSPDGRRFLRIQATEPDPPPTRISIVLNWFQELREKVGTQN